MKPVPILLALNLTVGVQAFAQTTPTRRFPLHAYSLMDSVQGLDANSKSEWKDRARDEIDSDPRDPLPLLELGYLYLDQGVDRAAWSYFEKALDINESFAPGHFALAEWAKEAKDDQSTIANLKRAQELDPEAVPILYALGKALLRGTTAEKETGLDLLERVAMESPAYEDVLDEVDRLLRSTPPRRAIFASEMISRFPKNERVLRLAASPDPDIGSSNSGLLFEDDARRAYGEAVALLQAGEVEKGTEAYIGALNRSPPSVMETIREDVEAFFGEEHLEQAVASREVHLSRAILDLWMNDDPTPTTLANEVLAEFYKRLREVRARFGAPIGKRGYDDRGRVWLRLGPPDERFEGPGAPYFHPNETWLYQRVSGQRLVLNFVNFNNAGFRFASSLSEAIPSWTRREYAWSIRSLQLAPVMRELEAFFIPRTSMDPVYFKILADLLHPDLRRGGGNILNDLTRYDGVVSTSSMATALTSVQVQLAEEGEEIEIAVHAVSFEDGDAYTTWVLIGYRLEDLEPVVDSTGSYEYTVDKAATLFHDDGRVAFTKEGRGTARTPERVDSSDLVSVDGVELQPAPGQYRLGVRISDANSDKVGLYRFPLTLPAIDRSRTRLSDIVLADRIEPAESPSRFSRHDLRIVPSPTRTFDRSRPFWLYFEIYPPAGKEGQDRRYEMEVTIAASDRGVSLTRKIFGSLGRLLGREGESEIAIAYGREFSPADPSYENLSLDVSELPEGIYELRIKVTDADSGEAITRDAEFAVRE